MHEKKNSGPPPIPNKPRGLRSANLPPQGKKSSPSVSPPPSLQSNGEVHRQLKWSEFPINKASMSRVGPHYEHRINIPRSNRNVICAGITSKPLLVLGNAIGLELIDFDTGESISFLNMASDPPDCICTFSHSLVVISSHSGRIYVFDCSSGSFLELESSMTGESIRTLVAITDDSALLVSNSGRVSIIYLCNGKQLKLVRTSGEVMVPHGKILYNPNCHALWISQDRTMEVHQVKDETITILARFEIDTDMNLTTVGKITDLCYCGRQVISAHDDGSLVVWDGTKCIPEGYAKISKHRITNLTSTHNSDAIWMALVNGTINIVTLRAKEIHFLAEFKAHQEQVAVLASISSLDNILENPVVSICKAGGIGVWDGNLRVNFIRNSLYARLDEYSHVSTLSMRICSWNVDSRRPPENSSFWRTWLDTDAMSDIIVIGLQEIVDINSKSTNARIILTSKTTGIVEDNAQVVFSWTEALQRELPGYRLVALESMVGLLLVLYAKNDLGHDINHVSIDSIKNGLNGLYGNKGAISIRLAINNTSYCFTNAHLAAGQSNVAARDLDIANIFRSTRFPKSARGEEFFWMGDGSMISDHHYKIFFGDLNYRLQTSRDMVEDLLATGNIEDLQRYDQLQGRTQSRLHPLETFIEGKIDFPPTYKYDRESDCFDSSEKRRVPSYCDRILFSSSSDPLNGDMDIKSYASIDSMKVSDHRPIAATVYLPTRRIDPLQKEIIQLKVLQDWLTRL